MDHICTIIIFIRIIFAFLGNLYYLCSMMQKNEKIERLWRLDHVKIKPNEQIGTHARNEWELSYVIKGQGERVLDGHKARFQEEDLVLVVPNAEHGWSFEPDSADSDGNIECISLQWSSELFSQLELLFPKWSSVKRRYLSIDQCAVFDVKSSQTLVQKLLLLDRCEQEKLPILMLDLFLDILKELPLASSIEKRESQSIAEKRLKQVEIFTSCNYSRHITLSDVAKHVGMNRSAFCTFFRRETGESYMTYLNRHRLKVARQMIEKNDSNISSVCWACGFNDLGYFDRLFRREFAISPTESRR